MNKDRKNRITAFLCAVLMGASVWLDMIPAVYADDDAGDMSAEQAEAQQRINEIQSQIDAKKKEREAQQALLDSAKSLTNNTKGQLDALNEQNALLQEEINLLDDKISALEDGITSSKDLEAEQEALFHQQVRMEEEAGDISYWSVIFQATSISDLLGRIDFVNEVMEYNSQIIEDYRQVRSGLQRQESQLEDEVSAKDEAQEALAEQMQETEALYKEYKKSQEALQAEYDEIVAEEKALDGLMTEAQNNLATLGISAVAATAGGYAWPTQSVRGVTSYFGTRTSPGGIGSTNHKGVDLATPMYTKVYAAKAGTVTRAANKYDGYGNCVIIYHGEGNYTLYAHLSSFSVSEGQSVTQGQQIALSGNTGNSTGPHLHFGIQENNVWVDPLNYLSGWYWCGG